MALCVRLGLLPREDRVQLDSRPEARALEQRVAVKRELRDLAGLVVRGAEVELAVDMLEVS